MTLRERFLEVARLAYHFRQVDGSSGNYDASQVLKIGQALDAAIKELDEKLRAKKPYRSGKRKKKMPRRKGPHFIMGSVLNLDRRQSPERRAFEVQGDFMTCGACGNQKAKGAMCSTCFG